MDCSEVCRMNVVRLNSVFTSVSTYSTNTTFYKKKYIKDNNIGIQGYIKKPLNSLERL